MGLRFGLSGEAAAKRRLMRAADNEPSAKQAIVNDSNSSFHDYTFRCGD